MDIIKRKPRTINLRKKGIKVSSAPVKIQINDSAVAPIKKEWEGGTFSCIECGTKEAQELGRCRACDSEHQKIVARFDAVSKQAIEKVPQKITYRKEVSSGVIVTIGTLEPLR